MKCNYSGEEGESCDFSGSVSSCVGNISLSASAELAERNAVIPKSLEGPDSNVSKMISPFSEIIVIPRQGAITSNKISIHSTVEYHRNTGQYV